MGVIRRHGWWVLVIAVAAAMLWPRLADHDQVVSVPCTDIVAGCALPQSNAQLHFDRQPDALQRFKVFVTAADATEVYASFQMHGMEMGFNRYRLLPDGPGKWQAEVMLPACIQGRKDWLVILDVDGKQYALPFASR